MKRILVLALVGLLTACQTTTGNAPSTTQRGSQASLKEEVRLFALESATAQQYAKRCRIKLKDGGVEAATFAFVANLRSRGYTDQQIQRATAALRNESKSARDAEVLKYLLGLGVVPSDPNSFCKTATQQISQKTRLGSMIRRA